VHVGISSSGCIGIFDGNGEVQTATRSIPANGIEQVAADFDMGAGDLMIRGGSTGIMDGTFRYTNDDWDPEVSYDSEGESASLRVKNQINISLRLNRVNEWDVSLGQGIVYDLSASLGAGDMTIDVSELALSGLHVSVGAGDIDLDMSGDYTSTFDAYIDIDVGDASITLPSTVGVEVITDTDVGNVTAHGLIAYGNIYRNEAYGESPITITIEVDGDVADITLSVEE
jgi:hypothetical protein